MSKDFRGADKPPLKGHGQGHDPFSVLTTGMAEARVAIFRMQVEDMKC